MAGKNLVIVESPHKAETIQKYLDKDQWVVKASIGHIRDLEEHKLSVDVENGFQPTYVIPADKKKIVASLKKLAATASTVWLASDEDREGEAISWHLKETLELPAEKTRRIAYHEITKAAFMDAIDHPRDIDMCRSAHSSNCRPWSCMSPMGRVAECRAPASPACDSFRIVRRRIGPQ